MKKNAVTRKLRTGILFIFLISTHVPASILSSGGIGIPVWSPGARFMGMGFISIAQADPYTVSGINPASLHQIRWTQLSLDYLSENSRVKDQTRSADNTFSNFNGFSFAMPLGKGLGFALGMTPLTRLDYYIDYKHGLEGEFYQKTVKARGGLNLVSLSAFCNIKSIVGIGISGQYVLGRFDETWRIIYDGIGFTQTYNVFTTKNEGRGLTGGVIVHPNRSISVGGMLRPRIRLHTRNEVVYNSLSKVSDGPEGSADLPSFWGVGFEYQYRKTVLLGTEYSEEAWDRLKINGRTPANLEKSIRFAVGAEIRLADNPVDSYIRRMSYRLGFSLGQFYMKDAGGSAVREWTGTFGIGFPLMSPASRVDVGFGYGMRGSLQSNGIYENVFRINVSASLGEKWFVRR